MTNIEKFKTDIAQLDAQIAELSEQRDQLLLEMKEAEQELTKVALDEIVAKLKALNVDPTAIAKALGIPVAESTGKKPRAARGTAGPKAKGVAKYRNSVDPKLTWSGKGRQPGWVVTYLGNGGSLDQLLIKD